MRDNNRNLSSHCRPNKFITLGGGARGPSSSAKRGRRLRTHGPLGRASDIKLIRTNTTFHLSKRPRKEQSFLSQAPFYSQSNRTPHACKPMWDLQTNITTTVYLKLERFFTRHTQHNCNGTLFDNMTILVSY